MWRTSKHGRKGVTAQMNFFGEMETGGVKTSRLCKNICAPRSFEMNAAIFE